MPSTLRRFPRAQPGGTVLSCPRHHPQDFCHLPHGKCVPSGHALLTPPAPRPRAALQRDRQCPHGTCPRPRGRLPACGRRTGGRGVGPGDGRRVSAVSQRNDTEYVTVSSASSTMKRRHGGSAGGRRAVHPSRPTARGRLAAAHADPRPPPGSELRAVPSPSQGNADATCARGGRRAAPTC